MDQVTLSAFADELQKVAASHGLSHISKGRIGSRPISAAKLLAKDKAGTLYRKKHADAAGAPQDVRGDSADDPAAADIPHRKGETPSFGKGNVPTSEKTGSFLFPEGVEKERFDAKNDLETSRGMHGLAATSGLGAAYMAARAPKSLHEIVGGQQLYHGTTDPAAASIRKGGLDPSLGGTELGGGAAEGSKTFRADSAGKTFVSTSPGESRVYADMTQSRLEGKPYHQVSSGIKAVVPGATKGTVLKGALPYEDFHNRFKVDKTMPTLGAAPTAYFTNKRVEPEVFKSGLGDVVKKRLKDPSSLGGYLKSNPKRALKGVGALAAIPALAYAAPKLWGKGTEMRHAAKDKLEKLDKTGSLQGANTQTSPVMSGEDLRGAVANKARARGDTPTQDVAADQPNGRIEPRAQAFTSDPSAKRPKRGDVPTSDRNMNLVDRNDLRESTTTVTGLGQSSTNISAMTNPAEHT